MWFIFTFWVFSFLVLGSDLYDVMVFWYWINFYLQLVDDVICMLLDDQRPEYSMLYVRQLEYWLINEYTERSSICHRQESWSMFVEALMRWNSQAILSIHSLFLSEESKDVVHLWKCESVKPHRRQLAPPPPSVYTSVRVLAHLYYVAPASSFKHSGLSERLENTVKYNMQFSISAMLHTYTFLTRMSSSAPYSWHPPKFWLHILLLDWTIQKST